jgi:hypothetical protein
LVNPAITVSSHGSNLGERKETRTYAKATQALTISSERLVALCSCVNGASTRLRSCFSNSSSPCSSRRALNVGVLVPLAGSGSIPKNANALSHAPTRLCVFCTRCFIPVLEICFSSQGARTENASSKEHSVYTALHSVNFWRSSALDFVRSRSLLTHSSGSLPIEKATKSSAAAFWTLWAL